MLSNVSHIHIIALFFSLCDQLVLVVNLVRITLALLLPVNAIYMLVTCIKSALQLQMLSASQ